MKKNLALYQLVDSAFPTGAFSHSFGLETSFKEGRVNGPEDLYEWLKSFLSASLVPTEGISVYVSYMQVQMEQEMPKISKAVRENLQRLDRKLTLIKRSSESRNGTIKIGKRYLKTALALYPESGLDQYARWIDGGQCFGNPAIVHGWLSAYLEVAVEEAIFTHLYSSVNNILQGALRMAAVGQTDVQLILKRLYPLMSDKAEEIVRLSLGEEDLYSYAVIQEAEEMRHETLYSRLFMS